MCECNCVKSDKPTSTEILDLVQLEMDRQFHLWGDQEGVSLFQWMSILMEEVGEAAQALNDHASSSYVDDQAEDEGLQKIRDELVQVAAVAANVLRNTY